MTSIGSEGWIEFRFYRPHAKAVHLAGDFNGWSGNDLPMKREPDGWWSIALQLAAGEYRFRYVTDGQWFTDFAANGVEAGKFGWNSVLNVPATEQAVAA